MGHLLLKLLIRWLYPYLVAEDAFITATDVEGYRYDYVPSMGIFDPRESVAD